MEQWFDGIYLLGRYNQLKTGCWLLVSGGEAAVLELPPYDRSDTSPANSAQQAVAKLGVAAKYLLCTHDHGDHFSRQTLEEMRRAFPSATPIFHKGFQPSARQSQGIQWFDDQMALSLAGEPLFLVHAPKHSSTDTMVIFRGTICTGDWELGTVRTVNEMVPLDQRRQSAQKMIGFAGRHNYRIHRCFSVHGNDRRENVDFVTLMEQTQLARKLW